MKIYVTQKQFCILSRTLETYYFDTRWIEMCLSTWHDNTWLEITFRTFNQSKSLIKFSFQFVFMNDITITIADIK